MAVRPSSRLGVSDSPSQAVVVRGGSTIRSSTAGSQYDPSALRVEVHPQRDIVRVAAAGELDLVSARVLQVQLSELRDAGFEHVVLDLRELTFIDSAGVQLIFTEDRLARGAGRRFSLISGIAAVQRVLDLCGLSERLDFGDPVTPPVVSRSAPSRYAHVRPTMGIAFQSYLAELRQQARGGHPPITSDGARMQAQGDAAGRERSRLDSRQRSALGDC